MPATPSERSREPAPVLAGRFRVVSTLARVPGFTLFLAYDLRLKRWRTLQLPADEAASRRLTRDADLLGKLEHPAVERILDMGEDGPLRFAVRDRLAGQLAEHLPVAPPLAGHLVAKVADGLAHAHGRGVLHGHVRPSVVRFAEDGGPVLTGFGVIPKIDSSTTGRAAEPWGHLAPELRQRWRPDPQTEVYGLGALLFTIVAGRHQADLFYAEAYEGMMAGIPGPIRSVVVAACNYEPSARPQGVEAFRALLLARIGPLGDPGEPPWRPEKLPDVPPEEVVPDPQVAALIAVLGRKREEARAVVIKGESSTLEKTPLPYVMPSVQPRKDPGFHDPYEKTDPNGMPAYADRSVRATKRPVPQRVIRVEEAMVRPHAPPRRPILAIAAGVVLAVFVLTAGVVWVATAPRRADDAFVAAVYAEQTAAGILAESSPERAALEEAWFRFEDQRTPENAAAYVRLAAEAGEGATVGPEATFAVQRMRGALESWERAKR